MNCTCDPIMFVYNYCNNWTSYVGMVLSYCVPCIITSSSPIAVTRLILFIKAVIIVFVGLVCCIYVLICLEQFMTITKMLRSHNIFLNPLLNLMFSSKNI